MATYRFSKYESEKARDPEERRQWLADLHKSLDEAQAKASADWDPSMLKNEPLQNPQKSPPIAKRGPRGGRYTEALTDDGRPYRRYF
jgi:hypothetical protein